MAKMIMAVLLTILAAHSPAGAGDISAGATPGTINYQGRLERDNSPVTGTVHIYFRIFNSPTGANLGVCGAPAANPCLWQSPEIKVQAVQGMFTAAIEPPIGVFSSASDKYLEVEIESETLSPREKINSVVYAYIAKKLEDGSSVAVSTLTSAYSVYMATVSGNVGIGTTSPANKLTVNGIIQILPGGGILFPGSGGFMDSAGIGAASNIAANASASIVYDTDNTGTASLVVRRNTQEHLRFDNVGNLGIGDFNLSVPLGKLDVDGSLYVGNEGIYDRDDGQVNIKEDLIVEGGNVAGIGNNSISIGETANTIIARTNNADRLWLNSGGNLGVGATAPANERVYALGNIYATAGVRGGVVSIGGYNNTWTALPNEIRADAGAHLLLQQTNSFNVGVGTDTPREKLHVRGSVRADFGVIASSGHFSGSGILGGNPTLDVRGNLRANTGQGNTVELSSTVVYGSLQVTGGILGSAGGTPAYLSDNQTFTGRNIFTSVLTASTDVVVSPRLGVGMSGFDFGLGANDRYLQVGDNIPAWDTSNAHVYIVGGANADARLNLYRGGAEAARVETQGANTLALVAGGITRARINPAYFTIQNSPVWVSPSGSGDPALFVSAGGSVGLGEQVTDPAWRLTVDGGIRLLSGPLIFPDGSSMTSSSATAATSVSSLSDALVQAGLGGSGSVIIKSGATDGIVVTNTGRVGVGTTSPLARLNVRGGDLVVGSPAQGDYAINGVEDVLVGGSLVVDGGLVQRSATPVQLAAAVISGDVYLSTATAGKTGIGTSTPQTKLEVNGDAQFGTGAQKSTFTAAGALNLRTPLAAASGGTGANLSGTGGANQFVRQNSLGGAFTVSGIGDADVPDAISINGTDNVTWASVNKTGSSLAHLAARSAGDLNTGTLAVARGGSGADLSGTGGANQFVRQNSLGGAFTVSGIGDADVPDTVTLTNITQITNRSHTNLADIGTNSHAQIDTHIGNDSAHNAVSANTPSRIVMRDASGNFAAGTITASLTGNISGNAGTATALAADPADCALPNVALGINAAGTAACAQPTNVTGNAATATNATNHIADVTGGVHGAASANTASMIVRRDASGNFAAGTITANLTGNADTATALAANPGDCTLPNVALGITAAGAAVCAQPTNVTGNAANVTGTVAVANGGTGRSTLTAGSVLVGDAANQVVLVAGQTTSFTVAKSTNSAGGCKTLTFTNGILTASPDAPCP